MHGHSGINIRGTGTVQRNGGHGLASSKYVQISGGRINENGGYGIASPVVRMSGTQIGNNGSGGISGKNLGAPILAFKNISQVSAAAVPPLKSIIRGSAITGNSGDGIVVDTEFPFVVEGSNISGNTGFGINNAGTGSVIAEGNWWGSAAGPGSAVNGSVQATGWQSSSVGVYVGTNVDSVFVLPGEIDSVSIVAANWSNPSDSLSIDAVDSKGWLMTVTGKIVVQKDSTPGVTTFKFTIPENAVIGDTSRVIVSGMSLSPSAATTKDTFYLVVYAPSLFQVIILKDTLLARSGDTLQITATGFDQTGRERTFNPQWTATGGTISSTGLYIAGPDTGIFVIHAADSSSGLKDSVAIRILGPEAPGAPSNIGLSTVSVNAGSTVPGTQVFPEMRVTNSAGSILKIDSLKTLTQYFIAVRSPDVSLLRVGDTISIVITFAPDSNRVYHDTLYIYNNSPVSPAKVILTGSGSPTGIETASNNIPDTYVLQQNYPNPFNPSTTIRFGVPVTSNVRLIVYDLLGRQIARLVDGVYLPGYMNVVWSAPVASGIYFYRIESSAIADPSKQFVQTRRMIFLK